VRVHKDFKLFKVVRDLLLFTAS